MSGDMRLGRSAGGTGCLCDRRLFLGGIGSAAGLSLVGSSLFSLGEPVPVRHKEGARVRAVFLYPPSSTFADDENGWWSWPGNDFDAERRQEYFSDGLAAMAREHDMTIAVDDGSVATGADAERIAAEIAADPPDGLLLVMFYNRSLPHADRLLKAAEEGGIPAVFYIGLGVKHGTVAHYRRPGVYFIQSLDNLPAIGWGMRMINTRKRLKQSLLLSITEAPEPREGVEQFFGVTVRVIPFRQYAERFKAVDLDADAKQWLEDIVSSAREVRGVTPDALENAARAHLALKGLLADEGADGLTMNCLRRGMLKPCLSFAALNGALVPAACENDFNAMYSQLIGQLLLRRPGFQHNPCFETERNHYYASHCTCPAQLRGPEGAALPYLLRRFGHTNEGSCALQVFWEEGEPVTMFKYYTGKEARMDVYAGRVVRSHPMPPAGGCTTNVEIELTDRADACMVRGHHNLLFCGDYARQLRLFAQLHRIELLESGYDGVWPL